MNFPVNVSRRSRPLVVRCSLAAFALILIVTCLVGASLFNQALPLSTAAPIQRLAAILGDKVYTYRLHEADGRHGTGPRGPLVSQGQLTDENNFAPSLGRKRPKRRSTGWRGSGS